MTWSNLRFSVWRSFVTMATNLPSCFFMQFLEQLLKFLVNFTLLKYVKSQRSYGFLITKKLIFGFQILDLKDHFSASLTNTHIESLQTLQMKYLKVDSHDPIFSSNYSSIHFLRQQLDVLTRIFDKFPTFCMHWIKIEHVLFPSY